MQNQRVDFQELSRQLRCPSGDNTSEMADNMFQSNANMIEETINRLALNANVNANRGKPICNLLEIGFANGKHLPQLIAFADNLHCQINYQGIDISPAMVEEAKQNNQQLLLERADFINFSLVDEHQPLPFESKQFDICFSANTLYFWQDPQAYVNEIYQLLKTGGQFAVSFINKDFADKLPLDREIFNFYQAEEVAEWLKIAGFKQVSIENFEELTTSKFGGEVLRPCSVVLGFK